MCILTTEPNTEYVMNEWILTFYKYLRISGWKTLPEKKSTPVSIKSQIAFNNIPGKKTSHVDPFTIPLPHSKKSLIFKWLHCLIHLYTEQESFFLPENWSHWPHCTMWDPPKWNQNILTGQPSEYPTSSWLYFRLHITPVILTTFNIVQSSMTIPFPTFC